MRIRRGLIVQAALPVLLLMVAAPLLAQDDVTLAGVKGLRLLDAGSFVVSGRPGTAREETFEFLQRAWANDDGFAVSVNGQLLAGRRLVQSQPFNESGLWVDQGDVDVVAAPQTARQRRRRAHAGVTGAEDEDLRHRGVLSIRIRIDDH